MILYISGLQNISAELYEVAKINGANKAQCIWYITFPLVKPTTYLVITLGMINAFSDFRSDRGNFEAEPAWLTGRIYEHGSYVPVSAVLQLYGHGIRKCGSDGTACYYFCAVPSTYAGQQRGGLNEKDTSLHCKIYGINFTGTDIPSADFICVL